MSEVYEQERGVLSSRLQELRNRARARRIQMVGELAATGVSLYVAGEIDGGVKNVAFVAALFFAEGAWENYSMAREADMKLAQTRLLIEQQGEPAAREEMIESPKVVPVYDQDAVDLA